MKCISAAPALKTLPTGAAMPDSDIDPHVLEKMRSLQPNGASDFLERVLKTYLRNSRKLLVDLQLGTKHRHTAYIRGSARSLKLKSVGIGAIKLATLCEKLESVAQKTTIGELPEALGEIEREYENVCTGLENIIEYGLPHEELSESISMSSSVTASFHHPLILLVNDDNDARFLGRVHLEQSGFMVEEADNAAAALAVFVRLRPDLVLLDVTMSKREGYTACSLLRRLPDCGNVPILMLIESDDLVAINRSFEVGATDFITTPINWTILAQRLRYMLRAGRNIQEIVQTREAIQESEERYRSLFQNNHTKMLLIDPDSGQIVDANPAACSYYGYGKEELTQKKITLNTLAREEIFHAMGQAKAGQQSKCCFRHRLANNIHEVEVFSGPIQVNGRQLVYSIVHDITERRQTEEQLKKSLQEKDVLLREIHHRVKNNMQIIISLLTLQAKKIRDQQAIDMFKECQNRIMTMALIHEILYQSNNLDNINMQEYITALSQSLLETYNAKNNNVKFNSVIENISINIEKAIPCGLIINELISNSLKHAFLKNQGGDITIIFTSSIVDELELTFRDNGIGLPNDFDLKACNTLGLKLIKGLAENQLGGEIQISRDHGTEIHIRFKQDNHLTRKEK